MAGTASGTQAGQPRTYPNTNYWYRWYKVVAAGAVQPNAGRTFYRNYHPFGTRLESELDLDAMLRFSMAWWRSTKKKSNSNRAAHRGHPIDRRPIDIHQTKNHRAKTCGDCPKFAQSSEQIGTVPLSEQVLKPSVTKIGRAARIGTLRSRLESGCAVPLPRAASSTLWEESKSHEQHRCPRIIDAGLDPAPLPCPAPSARVTGRRRRHERRGVLLLLMLSLLVLFAVLGVTYVLVASQFRRSTTSQPRLEQYAPDYRNQLDDAAMILFRGSTNPTSMIQDGSLLEDLYGTDAFKGTLSTAAVGSAGQSPDQLLDLTFTPVFYTSGSTITATNFSNIPGYYNGCVLTMTSGRLGE